MLLAIVGVLLGTVATVGVLVNNNNISDLSSDQDNICTTVSCDSVLCIFLRCQTNTHFISNLFIHFKLLSLYLDLFKAKALGTFTCTKSSTPTVSELGTCFDTLVAFSTPDC